MLEIQSEKSETQKHGDQNNEESDREKRQVIRHDPVRQQVVNRSTEANYYNSNQCCLDNSWIRSL